MVEESVIDLVLGASGFSSLNPVQEMAIKAGLLTGKNMVVAAPTASGKTVIAEIAALNTIMKKGKKAVYIVPLRALASEKFEEFKRKYEPMGIRVAMSMGDLDSSDTWLERRDLIVITSEKLDSLLRRGIPWIHEVGLVVADEIHLLDSTDRGPTLEVVLTRLRQVCNPTILGLSATISNHEELAEWLDAECIKSDWRPVELYSGICFDGDVKLNPKRTFSIKVPDMPLHSLIDDTLEKSKQSIIFVNTRRGTESAAEKIGLHIRKKIGGDQAKLDELSEKVKGLLEHPTVQCKRLAGCIKNGTAFHHAGLANKQRALIEKNFKDGFIKFIFATPTLCVHESANVWSGIKELPISRISNKNKILALRKNEIITKRPIEANEMKAPKSLINITTKTGKNILLTGNHRILVRENGRRVLKEAEKCKKWDCLATVGRINIRAKVPKWSDFIIDNKFPFKDNGIESDIFYLLGAFLGDGYSGAEIQGNMVKYKGSPTIVNEDETVLSKIVTICRKYGIYHKKCKNYYGTSQIILTKSRWFRELLVRCGIDVGVNKNIPKKILESPISCLSEFLKGLYDTDGYVNKGRNIGITTISPKLLKGIEKGLLRFGIVGRNRKRSGKPLNIFGKEYQTKDYYEHIIANSAHIRYFQRCINFNVPKKKTELNNIVDRTTSDIIEVKCERCGFSLHTKVFKGRTEKQNEWGKQKRKIIEMLGKRGPLISRDLANLLGFEPKKNERRVNHHYDFINKTKYKQHDWLWDLNETGIWVYNEILTRGRDIEHFFIVNDNCPLCSVKLTKIIRKNWRGNDIDGDIYWDRIKNIEKIDGVGNVFDVVMPSDGTHDHLFVSNGIFVHNSAGINLPAYRVIIRDLKRFTSFRGMDYIPVLEIQQMMGRAGRPSFDHEGEAIIIPKNKAEADYAWENYILGEPEKIYSKLGVEPVLRMHVLALIASGTTLSKQEIMDFFFNSFYAHQYKDLSRIEGMINKVINMLKDFGFVEGKAASTGKSSDQPDNPFKPASVLLERESERLMPTLIGRRVAELYLDPISAHSIIENLNKAKEKKKELTMFPILHLISNTMEMKPAMNIRKKDMEEIEEVLAEHEGELLDKSPNQWDLNYEDYIRSIKTAHVISQWANEMGEDYLFDTYGTTPGELRSRLTNADWMLYSIQELANILGNKDQLLPIRKARIRIKYGVREELLVFVKLKGVGRARARALYTNNVKGLSDLRKIPLMRLSEIVGPKIAENLKEQVGASMNEKTTESEIKNTLNSPNFTQSQN